MEQCGVQQVEDKGIIKWPLTFTYDVGWQKHALGKNYNSLSGHGFLVGGYTSKVILCICYSKGCSQVLCECLEKQGLTWAEATKDKPNGRANEQYDHTLLSP